MLKVLITFLSIVPFVLLLSTTGLNAQISLPDNNTQVYNEVIDYISPQSGITLTTNKQQFLPGETVIISGSIFNGTKPLDTSFDLQISNATDNQQRFFYFTQIVSKNGTFTFSGFTAPRDIGTYRMSAFNSIGSDFLFSGVNQFEVVNPLLTVQYMMLILAFGCFGGLIFVILKSGQLNFATSEILRFVLISGIVIAPIVGLMFSDSELGINSPISLIVKPQDKNGETQTDAIWQNQWFIAVGGMKINNYMSGILIPIYVIIFGLAGGYLRYLYNTSIKIWHLETTSDVVSSDIRLPLFSWNKVPSDQGELQKFKAFLTKSLNADWIRDGSIVKEGNKIISKSKDEAISITIEAFESNKIASVKLGNAPYGNLFLEKQQDDLYAYQTIERKTWSFYQSLADLSLLLLSPLLAIAAWFILTRGGDIDKYIVALVSFTVGLATYTIISILTDFTTQRVRTEATSAQNK